MAERPVLWQAEREEHQMMIDEKQSRALLKNTFDPLLSQITKVAAREHLHSKSMQAGRLSAIVFRVFILLFSARIIVCVPEGGLAA